MWSSRRTLLLGGLSALGAGCGFAPLYAPDTAARALTGKLAPDQPTDGFEFILHERLITRIGTPEAPQYRLTITPEVIEDGRAIRSDNTITRFTVAARAAYAVIPFDSADPVTAGTVRAQTAYSAVASPFATRAAEEDALDRVARALADQIATRLAITAEGWLR